MGYRTCGLTLAGLVATATIAAGMQPPPGAGGQPPAAPGERRPERSGAAPSVEGAMKGMNRAIKQLRGQAADPAKRDENLRLVNDAQRNLVAAKGQPFPEPLLASAKDEAAKATLREHYRKDLIIALGNLVKLETAIFENKADDARAAVEELVTMRDAAHKELGVSDE